MKIAEIFYSVQGEGSLVGVPSLFVRTSGCNLRCSWCDTPYASWDPEGQDWSAEAILAEAARYPAASHVVLTGGEPMIMPGIEELSQRFRDRGMHITIETAGTIFAPVSCDLMSISPKLANSTPEGVFRQQHERLRLQPDVLLRLMAEYNYQLKFVIASAEDGEEARLLIATLRADASKVILMAEGTNETILNERGRWIAEICKQHGYRFSPRLHVHLYGNQRGT
ncbi:MAG: 7-carboxy-7-deazaguanine synthase QueE [Acidobacteriota bacterium]|nr:7-carboxy-7-deazaguanine synthase QueE [Acidobacteriota bacterium]